MMRAPAIRLSSRILLYVLLILLAVVFLIPAIFIAFTSLKSNPDLAARPFYAFPEKIQWKNYADAWKQGRLFIYMKNSLIISVLKVPLGILIEALAAFALTRMHFPRSSAVFAFFLVGLMVPFQATLIPLKMFLSELSMINTYQGIFLVYVGFGIPFGILVLRGFFRTIPKELDDAALIDGCGDLRRFFQVILPLSLPAVATLIILDFLATWNEFLLAQIIITKDSMRTVTTGLLSFQGQFSTNYTLMSAAVLIAAMPILAVYLVFQKYFVSGIAGSVKG